MNGPENRGDSCPFSRSVRCSSPSAVCRGNDEGEVLADTYPTRDTMRAGDGGLKEIMKDIIDADGR